MWPESSNQKVRSGSKLVLKKSKNQLPVSVWKISSGQKLESKTSEVARNQNQERQEGLESGVKKVEIG